MILDNDRLAGIDQFLQSDLVTFGEVAVLPLPQQPFDFLIDGVQLINVSLQLGRHTGIAIGICGGLQFNQRIAGIGSQRFEGFRPLADNFIGFLLAVRPDSKKPGEPLFSSLCFIGEVAFTHAEERKAIAFAIESFSSSIFPAFSGFRHAFECFTRLLCTGNIVGKRNRANHNRCSNSQPHRRRLAQNGHKALEAASSFADSGSKLADTPSKYTDALGNLADAQENWTGCSCDASPFDDLKPLCFIHFHEAVE